MSYKCRYCGQNDWGKHSCNRCGAAPSEENPWDTALKRLDWTTMSEAIILNDKIFRVFGPGQVIEVSK